MTRSQVIIGAETARAVRCDEGHSYGETMTAVCEHVPEATRRWFMFKWIKGCNRPLIQSHVLTTPILQKQVTLFILLLKLGGTFHNFSPSEKPRAVTKREMGRGPPTPPLNIRVFSKVINKMRFKKLSYRQQTERLLIVSKSCSVMCGTSVAQLWLTNFFFSFFKGYIYVACVKFKHEKHCPWFVPVFEEWHSLSTGSC